MEEPSSLSATISAIPGEPAIVINGVPKLPQQARRSVPVKSAAAAKAEAPVIACLGDWMGGREVRKMFGDKYYTGRVTQYDKETRWYRVVYEDGDFEDLEWHELHEIIVPLDINTPLKALALKVISNGIDLNPLLNKPIEPPKEPIEPKEPPKEPTEPPKEPIAPKEPSKEPIAPKEPPNEPITPKEPPKAAKLKQKAAKETPIAAKETPKASKKTPKAPKESPKESIEPKEPSKEPIAPKEPSKEPIRPKEPPKAAKLTPRAAKKTPKAPKEPPKVPNEPKEIPNTPKEAPKELKEPKTVVGRTTRSSAKKAKISM